MIQQYKKIPVNWACIRRFDDPSKTLSEKAIHVMSVAMYQIDKYGHAILTQKILHNITGSLRDQNRRLIKNLGFIFNLEFSRCLIENKKKYNDSYKLTLTKSAAKILENPEVYFAKFKNEIASKDRSKKITTSQQKKTIHRSKNASMSQQKCVDVAAKMLRSQDALHIYLKKLILKEIVKTNSSLNYEFFVLISLLNFQVEIDPKYSDQEDKILSLIKNNCTFPIDTKFDFASIKKWLINDDGCNATKKYSSNQDFNKRVEKHLEQWCQDENIQITKAVDEAGCSIN